MDLFGYREGFNTQTSLLRLVEKSLDKKGYVEGILMDLSKAFDIIIHELLLVKLNAYDLGKNSLQIIQSYLVIVGKEQRSTQVLVTKMCATRVSSWTNLIQHISE